MAAMIGRVTPVDPVGIALLLQNVAFIDTERIGLDFNADG